MASIAYGNPVTRVRAREKRLMDDGRINRMLEVQKNEDLLKILQETDYSPHMKDMEGIGDYEQILSLELQRIYGFMKELSPNRDFLQLITLPHDLQNIKITVKSRQSQGQDELLNELGLLPLSKLEETLTVKGWREITSLLGEPFPSLAPGILEESEPQIIDILLDRARFQRNQQLLKKLGSRLLKEFFFQQADLLNIEIFIRTRDMGEERTFLEKALLHQGTLDTQIFLWAFKEPLSFLLERLKMTAYAEVVDEGLRHWQEKGDLTLFEKKRDNLLTKTLKEARFILFGPEPLFAYLWAKETEIKTLRMIFIGKMNRLPDKVIRERLRDLYV